MDSTKNTVLKENYTFFVGDEQGRVAGGERGLYSKDTRFLSRYLWSFGAGASTLTAHSPRPDTLRFCFAHIDGYAQRLGITRNVTVAHGALSDSLEFTNTSLEAQAMTLGLEFTPDFGDLFEARGWHAVDRRDISRVVTENGVRFGYTAADGRAPGLELSFEPKPLNLSAERAEWQLELAPGQTLGISAEVRLDDASVQAGQMLTYDAWRDRFAAALPLAPDRGVLEQAVDDLRALLLSTEHGLVPAAGIPWYVAAFGRDSLLTALMTLAYAPDMAEGTLRFLAAHQGKKLEPFRVEAPGKIMHEIRYGELSRTAQVPFGPYYGTIDATALWVILLHKLWRQTGDDTLAAALRPNLEAALDWLVMHGKGGADRDGDGFLEFVLGEASDGKGLVIQSWKDSADSMSHRDGTLAGGSLAVSEVQGYAYAAYLATTELLEHWQADDQAALWRERAARLQKAFHKAFWLPDLQTYAMALDGDKRPLRVHNSGAGRLLWTGIVPPEAAPKLVETLFSAPNWSGWGLRTLGQNEVQPSFVPQRLGLAPRHRAERRRAGGVRLCPRSEAYPE